MIDSVLKGTGNSRFLKSAVPAGTSWADALAMLQAGTFPIDFNGINTKGFQQVGTPLNKANLLKDATAAQIGLPPSTTPDGMFQALGNTGELHVWRKTVTTAQEIPAKYELGELQTGSFQFVGSGYVTWEYGTPNVGDDGTVSLVSPGSSNVNYSSNLNDLRGKYCKPNQASGVFLANQVIFIPSDAVFTQSGSAKYISKYQPVIGTPKIPAGTTTTYPVSTNPNAYQEGDDAKEAGYVLGDAVTGSFALSVKNNGSTGINWKYSNDITVSDAGIVELVNPYSATINAYGYASNAQSFRGKFIVTTLEGTDFIPNTVCFIPAEANIAQSGDKLVVDRYQPVTGYAAIPAGTTIEYLGKLGDKARVQVVSYVGTGTYGESNPCSLTFGFPPKVVISLGYINPKYPTRVYSRIDTGLGVIVFPAVLSATAYSSVSGFSLSNTTNYPSDAKVSLDRKSVIWKNTSSNYQLNESGYTYYYLGIG